MIPSPVTVGKLAVVTLPLGAIETNCYVANALGCDRAVVIDPGGDHDRVVAALKERSLTPEAILVTHCHWDHIGAVAPLAKAYEIPVYMSRIEAPVLENIADWAPAGLGPWEPYSADHLLDGGERIELAGIEFEVVHLPGHSPGTLGFFVDGEPPVLFVGDLIFRDSVGRTDLPFADTEQLFTSILKLVEERSHDTVLYPGHGPDTTLGRERRENPFIRA